ncbi:MAG: hypothetical protein WCG20_03815 [bacterium]
MNPEENTVVSEEVILTPEELAKKHAEEAASEVVAEAPAEAASEEVAA